MNNIKINISKDPKFGYSNLSFSEKPTEEMLKEMKSHGWRYSSHFKRWYPGTEEARRNSEVFAQEYIKRFSPEEQGEIVSNGESFLDLNAIENAVDAYIAEKESEMQKGNYAAFIEVQNFVLNNNFITSNVNGYIKRFVHSIEDIKGLNSLVAYGNNFYTYEQGEKLVSELNKKIEKYESIKNNPGQNDYNDLLEMIKTELEMLDNSQNKGTLYSVLQREGDLYEKKLRRSNERSFEDERADYSREAGRSFGNEMEEQRSIYNSNEISDPAGHRVSHTHAGRDNGISSEYEADGASADLQGQQYSGSSVGQEELSETGKINDSTRNADAGLQNLSEGRVEVHSNEPDVSTGEHGNGLTELTEDDLDICSKVIPRSQFNFTLELTQGEEGEFFKKKLKETAEIYRKINTNKELVNKDGTHNVGFRYFLGSTEIFLSEIDSEGVGFGYTILNGDLQMSEWGYSSLEEITSIPFIEMDYHVPEGITIERMLYKEHPEYFPEYAPEKETIQEKKPYNYFINDSANLDLGIGAEIEPITGLSAEEAARKYAELKDKGLDPYIGLNIPGDIVFDDQEGQGAGIFTETYEKNSFYFGENFVKELKQNDEHAKNVIAAYKELYEMAEKYIQNVEKPEFLFEKDNELNGVLVEAENGEKMTPEQLRVWNEEQEMQHSQDAELDDLKEGKQFALDASKEELVNQKMNFVLEKLTAAGIEVVKDKDEFERILNNVEILQKMVEENSVEDLFVSINDKNLDSEIDKLTVNDIHLKNDFIEISKETPFILRQCGLDNYPVCMYKQKLARALFLEKEEFGERRTHGHKGEFTDKDVKEVFSNLGNPRYVFNSTKNNSIPDDFYVIGVYDQFDKNNNPMMVSFHFNKNTKEVEANWVTAVYGRNKIDIMKNWVEKGYLLYINDTEIEKASAEVGTLYMRVIHNANAYSEKIIRKSDFVNNLDMLFYKLHNQTYGFAHNGKIYLNPEIANSEVAIHEYTHLWDNYIQRTNSGLWEIGKNIFKNTHYWNDVKNDPNYADIADNDDLLLSEVHSQLVGKMAEEVLNKIIERDGELTKDSIIDWDKECWAYLENTLWFEPEHNFSPEELHDFLAMPMKDFMNGVQITKQENEQNPTYNIGGFSYTKSQIEEELEEDIKSIFRNLVPEPYLAGISLYQNPEKNGKINILVQYGTDPMEGTWREDDLFNVIAEENILFNGMEVDVNPITPEKSGTIDEYLKHLERLGVTSESEAIEKQAEMLEEPKELNVFTFAPFGYEGAIVKVETDLRRGIPAYDIVGISDGIVRETRERIRRAFLNSGLDFPAERVLQSLSPADLKKDTPLDLSMALSILGKSNNYPIDEPILALGELELSGGIRPVRGAVAAVNSARAYGISNIVCDPTTAELLKDIHGINILVVKNLKEANEKLHEKNAFRATEPKVIENETVQFRDDYQELLDSLNMDGHFESIRAIEVAVAGKHNILLTGAPGSGKTMLMQRLMPALTPKLTNEETITPRRISSIAGLDSPNKDYHIPPFRMPHQTASIEGICGGGANCRPGEISLAHNGTLFLDESAEFRSSVLQMLRVPLESHQITLSRAGRTTVYPANFQLAMATNPCPCGCYGSHDKICLDSAKSIDLYWKKISDPLLDRVEIKSFVEKNENDTRKMSIETMKAQIAKAFEIQRKRGVYNSQMTPMQIEEFCKLDEEGKNYIEGINDKLTPRGRANLLRLSLTLANMDGREEIRLNDLKEARELSAPVFEKPQQFVYQPSGQNISVQPVEPEYKKMKFVQEKLAAAGIEVVKDKDEFERILEREKILQKMSGTLTAEEQRRYFTFDEEDTKRFIERVDEWQKQKTSSKNYNPGKLIEVGKIPPIMKILGIADKPIEIQYYTISKILRENPLYPNDKQGHKLTIDDIYAIPSQLADPVMVFKSRTRADSFVFFTERKDSENHSILIPLAVNKQKGRIVINEITSMYGKDNEIDFVMDNIIEGNLIYADKKRSLEWERECKVQFLTQGLPPQGSTPNILTKDRLVNFISSQNAPVQMMVQNGKTYGFAYDGKIYLNPEIANSEVAIHEYTHLWDNYIQRTNPELWEKGKNIFVNTKFWNDVKAEPNYADIADNDDLLLSEVHAQLVGKMADEILSKILERDGELTKDTVIDWDKEVDAYIYNTFENSRTLSDGRVIQSKGYGAFGTVVDINAIRSWFAQPMKDFMNGVYITKDVSKEMNSELDIFTNAQNKVSCRIIEKGGSTYTGIVETYQNFDGANKSELYTNVAMYFEREKYNSGVERHFEDEKVGEEFYKWRSANWNLLFPQNGYHHVTRDFGKVNPDNDLYFRISQTNEQLTSKKDIKAIREQCREILQKPDSDITEEDKTILAQYEGAGGIKEKDRSASGILNEFYTPNNLVEKVWQLVDSYAPNAKTVLEPSAGVGKFANNRPNNEFTMHELDETSARINKLLHPDANVIQGAYQKQFFDAGGRIHIPGQKAKYDVVIGNPPYGAYNDKYKGLGEGKEFDRYEEYFISKGLDALKDENSVMAFVVPSGFLNSASDKQKEIIASKGKLIDAYRLPVGTFPTTEVGTDIIIMQNWEREKNNPKYTDEIFKDVIERQIYDLSDNHFFSIHPEKILGEVKTRTNRFGKEEEYVAVHEGLTVQDELNKIAPKVQKVERSVSVENKNYSDEIIAEAMDDPSKRLYDDPDGLFETPKILSMQEFSKFYTGNNFDEKDYNIWANTDYRGIVNTASLSAEEKEYLKTSGKYVEPEPGIYTNAMLYATGKIYEKLDELEKQKENLSSESYEKCKAILEKAIPELYPMSKIQMDVLSPLAEEFTVTRTVTRKQWDYGVIKNVTSDENLNLKEDFLSWCTGYLQPDSENTRTYIQDFSVANVSREEIPENISFNDVAAYADRIPVNTGVNEDDTKEQKNAKLTVAGAKKDARKETAYKLFNRYLQTGLSQEEKDRFCLYWNKIYNGTVQADYKKLPLFIDGMSTFKGNSSFKLYKQQIEGISRLVSKGNGLLAYGVGVGKTAAGIGATVAQLQSKRSKRPLIIVPNQVYKKWVRDLRELFPNVAINELGNLSEPFLEANHYDESTHSLIIPENSVSVMTDSALQKITFTDEACDKYLAKDFGCVLGLSSELEGGDDRERANALQKIQNLVGRASRIKTVKVPGDEIARETEIQQSYVFFDRCNFDNVCVDEAHNYKNLFVVPRAKKGDKKQANEFEGIGSASQSRRALKMFGITTIIQQQNDNRNVFLLTATPFTNNPLEVYSMLSFMARKELLDRHIYDVRDFCTEFALTKNEYAVTPDGDIKPKNVMKAFKGQKKLHSLITEFIDSKSAEDAGIPKPEGERHAVYLELTDLQQQIINYNEAAIKTASGKDGVVLKAMTHMRTATLSPALLDPADYPGLEIPPLEKVVEASPKLKYVCDTVADVYKFKPECGQFIYMPQGVESFQYVKEYLVKQGVPEEAIEYVSGKHNNTNEKKQKVADRFNDKEDKLKILIGSSNVAEGIDLNGNSICCYNTMLGWNPTESVQVEGRIWRQGNEQGKVHIYYPLMEDSIDALIYQKHDEKVSRINSIFKENETDEDTIDVSEIDPETVKFELIKDPVKKVDMLIEQDTAEFKKELKILENRTETINDLVKAYGIIKNMIAEEKSEHEKYSELVKQYRENLKNIPENDSTRWQHEGRLEAAVHTRDVAYKELQKGNARMNSIMTNFMRMDIKVPETEAAIKLEEISRKKQAIQEKIESIEKSKDKRIEEEQIKLLQKKLVAKPLEQQRKETVEYILKNTWYKTTEEKVEPEKPVVKDASITTEPLPSIPIKVEEKIEEPSQKAPEKAESSYDSTITEEERKSYDSYVQQEFFDFDDVNQTKVLNIGEYKLSFAPKFVSANKGLLPVLKESEGVYKIHCKGKELLNVYTADNIYIHDSDDVEIAITKEKLQEVAKKFIQEQIVENIKAEYEDANFKRKKIVVPKLSEMSSAQKELYLKNGITDENEMVSLYKETYKDIMLSGEKPVLVAKKQEKPEASHESNVEIKEITYVINDDMGY